MARGLEMWGLKENTTTTFTPTLEEMQSSAFKVIVGEGEFTASGKPVSTIVDVIHGGHWTEIKLGTSPLTSSYQLRLQTYFAVKTDTPYTIATTRPINPTFATWLKKWGVNIP
jgi:filamentous hemagglutinin